MSEKKNLQFSFFIAKKVKKQNTVKTLQWQKPKVFLCVRSFFKWYHSMIRCKSYGPLSDEWQKQSGPLSPLSCRGHSALTLHTHLVCLLFDSINAFLVRVSSIVIHYGSARVENWLVQKNHNISTYGWLILVKQNSIYSRKGTDCPKGKMWWAIILQLFCILKTKL